MERNAGITGQSPETVEGKPVVPANGEVWRERAQPSWRWVVLTCADGIVYCVLLPVPGGRLAGSAGRRVAEFDRAAFVGQCEREA